MGENVYNVHVYILPTDETSASDTNCGVQPPPSPTVVANQLYIYSSGMVCSRREKRKTAKGRVRRVVERVGVAPIQEWECGV